MQTQINMYIHTYGLYLHTCTYIYVHIYTYKQIHMHMHICINMRESECKVRKNVMRKSFQENFYSFFQNQ